MTTASTNTTVAQTSNATFQAWVNEVYTNLVTNCGLTQTSDTGQMAVPCVTNVPGAGSTSAGYYVFKFNDTLQATSPVFIKLEFGSGSAAADPQMWITVGSGSNGSGTINGTAMTRVACGAGGAPLSTVTNYVSRYCYNATQGFLGLVFKVAALSASGNQALAGFFVFRSVNSAGNSTADSVMLLTNSATATGAGNPGTMQVLSYNLSAAYLNGNPIAGSTAWCFVPFSSTGTLEGTAGQIFPVFQWNGSSSVAGYGITNAAALGMVSEVAVNSTITVTVLGSVSLTYMSVGGCFGANAFGLSSAYAATTYSVLMLWQ
jgi:hypothetical protein